MLNRAKELDLKISKAFYQRPKNFTAVLLSCLLILSIYLQSIIFFIFALFLPYIFYELFSKASSASAYWELMKTNPEVADIFTTNPNRNWLEVFLQSKTFEQGLGGNNVGES